MVPTCQRKEGAKNGIRPVHQYDRGEKTRRRKTKKKKTSWVPSDRTARLTWEAGGHTRREDSKGQSREAAEEQGGERESEDRNAERVWAWVRWESSLSRTCLYSLTEAEAAGHCGHEAAAGDGDRMEGVGGRRWSQDGRRFALTGPVRHQTEAALLSR
jgi:hypothetical protein